MATILGFCANSPDALIARLLAVRPVENRGKGVDSVGKIILPMNGKEKRIHARLQGSMDIEVVDARGEFISATLRDLSQGGASLVCECSVAVGDKLSILLPSLDGSPKVPVAAKVMRTTSTERGFACGVQFIEVQASRLAAVDYLLGVLFIGPGGERRTHPRISRRISVRCETPEELLAMIENISLGGLALNLGEDIEIGEELLVVLPAEDGEDLLSLTGRVVNCHQLADVEPPEFLIGLEFSDMSPQRLALLDTMLSSMLKFV